MVIPNEPQFTPRVVPFINPGDDARKGIPLFGNAFPGWQIQTFKLDTLTGDTDVPLGGQAIWIIGVTSNPLQPLPVGNVPTINVKFNRQDSAALPMTQGMIISKIKFGKLFLSWGSQPNCTITIAVSNSPDVFMQPGSTNLFGNLNGVVERPTTFQTALDTVLAPNVPQLWLNLQASRRRILGKNMGPNVATIGEQIILGGQGLRVAAGEDFTLMGAYPVYALSVLGTLLTASIELD